MSDLFIFSAAYVETKISIFDNLQKLTYFKRTLFSDYNPSFWQVEESVRHRWISDISLF